MANVIAASAIVQAEVRLGEGAIIDEFVLLGVGIGEDRYPLVIGPGARIRSHTVIYAGCSIGRGFQTGHSVMIREATEIGDDVSVGTHSIIEHHVVLGNRVRIHSGAFIPEYSIVEESAWIGPRVVFTNALYPQSRDVKTNLKGPRICSGAKIGANATLLPAIVIGANALVGAGAVVVDDVPDHAVVAGNPARILRDVRQIDAYKVGL